MRGFVYVAYGTRAVREAQESIEALRVAGNNEPVAFADQYLECPAGYTDTQLSRWAKLNLDNISPFDVTCYLDADTRPHESLAAGFQVIEDGWDMALAYSKNQDNDLLKHVTPEERRATLAGLTNPFPLQLQAGALFLHRERVKPLFTEWRRQWQVYRDQDQAALLRALEREPVRIWLLGRPWNDINGAIVEHLFGKAR